MVLVGQSYPMMYSAGVISWVLTDANISVQYLYAAPFWQVLYSLVTTSKISPDVYQEFKWVSGGFESTGSQNGWGIGHT